METKNILNILVIVLLAYVFCSVAATYWHENVHKSIFAKYGINSTIHYGFKSAYTMPERNCDVDSCTSLNALNEVIGYNVQAGIDIFYITLASIICIWIIKNEDGK